MSANSSGQDAKEPSTLICIGGEMDGKAVEFVGRQYLYRAAAAVYDREPCAVPFEHDLFMHLLHGYVISTPQVFAMLREVSRDFTQDEMRDPGKTAPGGDCWHVWLAAGDVSALFGMLPVKPWVSFERKNVLRVYRYNRLRRLTLIHRNSGCTPKRQGAGRTIFPHGRR